jgi:hypothetical protein
VVDDAESVDGQLAEADLRVLLDEAEAARAELTIRTEELSKRLATLETLVVGVTEALDEIRSTTPTNGGSHRGTGSQRSGSRRSQGRSGPRPQRPATPS